MICFLQSLVLHLWWRAFATILYYFNGAVALQSTFDLSQTVETTDYSEYLVSSDVWGSIPIYLPNASAVP